MIDWYERSGTLTRDGLFLDCDAIRWGDEWRKRVDTSLASVAFFIPVLTPRYFLSAECRRELQYFARQATNLGVRELVMSLPYVEVPGIHDDNPSDELMVLLKDFHWEDWTELRFAEPTSREYRMAVNRLAARLVEANRTAERAEITGELEAAAGEEPSPDEGPGVLDRMAEGQEVMAPFAETIQQFGEQIQRIGEVMTVAVKEFEEADKRGAGFPGRLAATRRMAQRLDEPVVKLMDLSNRYTSQLHSVDSGTRAIIESMPASVEASPESRGQACEFFGSVRNVAESARGAMAPLKTMIDQLVPMERLSRDLRPRLRTLRRALTLMIEAQEVMEDWLRLIDDSPVRCE